MQSIDTLIHARWIYAVDAEFTKYDHAAVAIDGGRILEILTSDEARQKYTARYVIERDNHVLIPGLINAHTHIAMSLFRGIADDLALETWLQEHIWPAEAKHINPDFIRLGTELGIAEMLRSGTTCFNDMYFYPDIVAETTSQLGIRACVGLIVIDFPSAWASNSDEYFSKGLKIADHYREDPLIETLFAPHAPYTVNDENLLRIVKMSNEMDKVIHIHLHETLAEVDTAVTQTGIRPITRLRNLGLLGPNLLTVHMTELNSDEIEQIAELGVSVVHCPESNMKLASGICPVSDLLAQGVNVALGTDGAASNNDLDMFAEMRTAALLAKVHSKDATQLNAQTALEMATINGARALNLEGEIGSLESGKWADITCIDLNQINTLPSYDPLSQLVYALNSRQVSDVWVAGKQLLNNCQLTQIDESSLKDRVRSFKTNIN